MAMLLPEEIPGRALEEAGEANRRINILEAAIASTQKLPNSEYTEADISDEQYREVIFTDGRVYKITCPVTLIFRKGGSTHRVVDIDGVAHCYAAPETGKTVLRWKSKPGLPAVKF